MVAEQIVLPYIWRRYLSLLRTLVGAGCLWQTLASRGLSDSSFTLVLAALTVYSLASIFWRFPERVDYFELLNSILDVQFFLLCVSLSGPDGFWISAISGFYLLLAMATLHGWRQVMLVTVISLGFIQWQWPPFGERLQPLMLLMGMFGCIVTLQKRALMERLSGSSRQAVLYRSEAETAREAERERIAADFHDGPLQSFISFQMRLEIVRKMLERNPEAGIAELRQLQELCAKQVTEVRTFIRGMRPVDVDGAGLASALRYLVGAFQKDTGITATFQAGQEASHDDFEASTDVMQIVREALNNVHKHSNASHVGVMLERRNGCLELRIEDDGSGFGFSGVFDLDELEMLRMGPASIKRRVRSLNGDLTVDSQPGRGASINIRVPV